MGKCIYCNKLSLFCFIFSPSFSILGIYFLACDSSSPCHMSSLSCLSRPYTAQLCWDLTLDISLIARTGVGGRSWEEQALSYKPHGYLKWLHILQTEQYLSSNKDGWGISTASENIDILEVQSSELDLPRILAATLRVLFLLSQGPNFGIENFLGLRMQSFLKFCYS